MDIQVGDRVTYKRNDDGITRMACITTQANNLLLNPDEYEILKIERPKWEVVEEKKELLTEEEIEFLQLVLKFINTEIKCITKRIGWNGGLEMIFRENEDGSGAGYWYYIKNSYFKNLEERGYTLKELGLEE